MIELKGKLDGVDPTRAPERFGRAMLAHILADQWFFHSEDSVEIICELLVSCGYAEFVAYDPAVHGECEADIGDMIWCFTDAMRRDAGSQP